MQTCSGKWLSIYGKVLHEHVVAASETYNTASERHLVETLGDTCVARPAGARSKRPVREIEGVSVELCERLSQRPTTIAARQRMLAREFRTRRGGQSGEVEAREAVHAGLRTSDLREPQHRRRSSPPAQGVNGVIIELAGAFYEAAIDEQATR